MLNQFRLGWPPINHFESKDCAGATAPAQIKTRNK